MVQFKANLWPCCSIMLGIILETMGVSGTLGRGEKEYILQPEGIDYVCLGMKGARTYYFGLCFSEASGSQSNGYLDGFSFLLLLNPASERC